MTLLRDRLDIELPIVLAPMGGSSTPELVAAVANAGGLGFLGAAYMSPEGITAAVARIRELSDRPFGVNLFAGGYPPLPPYAPEPMLARLGDIHAELGLPPPEPPRPLPDPFPAQLEAVLAAQVPVFSFTFGIPQASDLARLRQAGTLLIGTATTVEEGRLLAEAGVDALFAQGAEAGAHRGSFAAAFEASMVARDELTAGLAREVGLPVIACGGIMDGSDIAQALAAGAEAAGLGTAFLTCPESSAPPAHKQALLQAGDAGTVITRAFSGRPARGLANAFVRQLQAQPERILPYPLQNALTRPMRNAAAAQSRVEYLSLWAGTGVARARALPAAELVAVLARELGAALAGAEEKP